MVRLSRILSIALLVVHLVVGCCAHRVRACENQDPSAATHGDATLEGQCPACKCDPSHHGAPEYQDRKFFLAPPRQSVGGLWRAPCQASFAVLPNGQFPRLAISFLGQFGCASHFFPPVRLHLANQVWLI